MGTSEPIEKTVKQIHDWAVERMNVVCEIDTDDAYAIFEEFAEWMDPKSEEHDISSLEYIADEEM